MFQMKWGRTTARRSHNLSQSFGLGTQCQQRQCRTVTLGRSYEGGGGVHVVGIEDDGVVRNKPNRNGKS